MGVRTHDYFCFDCGEWTNGFDVSGRKCPECGSLDFVYDLNGDAWCVRFDHEWEAWPGEFFTDEICNRCGARRPRAD